MDKRKPIRRLEIPACVFYLFLSCLIGRCPGQEPPSVIPQASSATDPSSVQGMPSQTGASEDIQKAGQYPSRVLLPSAQPFTTIYVGYFANFAAFLRLNTATGQLYEIQAGPTPALPTQMTVNGIALTAGGTIGRFTLIPGAESVPIGSGFLGTASFVLLDQQSGQAWLVVVTAPQSTFTPIPEAK